MKRETPNQKLKRELLQCRRDLMKVCTEPDSEEAKTIIMCQQINKAQAEVLFFGNPGDFGSTFVGLIKAVNSEGPYVHYEEGRDGK